MKLVRGSAARSVALVLTLSAGSAAIAATGASSAVAVDQSRDDHAAAPCRASRHQTGQPGPLTVVAVSVTPSGGRRTSPRPSEWSVLETGGAATSGPSWAAEFRVATYASGSPVTYRATALAHQGLPAMTSATAVSNRWGAADFVDEFGGTALSASWSHRGPDYNPVGLRRCSKGSPQAVLVSGGAVRLSVMRDPARPDLCTAYRANGEVIGQFNYRLNGHISTAGRHDLTYGVVAARVRFQPRPASTLPSGCSRVPVPGEASAGRRGAEIDVIERFGAGLPERRPVGVRSTPRLPAGRDGKRGITEPGSYIKAGRFVLVEVPRVQRRVEPRRLRLPHRRPGDLAHQSRGSPSGRST